ncbi:hypothetical protein D3C81_500250 [compost metagenome]
MRKSDWLIAALLIGMGIMCMSVSAVSFRSMPMMHIGTGLTRVLLCAGMLALVLLVWSYWRKRR